MHWTDFWSFFRILPTVHAPQTKKSTPQNWGSNINLLTTWTLLKNQLLRDKHWFLCKSSTLTLESGGCPHPENAVSMFFSNTCLLLSQLTFWSCVHGKNWDFAQACSLRKACTTWIHCVTYRRDDHRTWAPACKTAECIQKNQLPGLNLTYSVLLTWHFKIQCFNVLFLRMVPTVSFSEWVWAPRCGRASLHHLQHPRDRPRAEIQWGWYG